MTWDWLDDVITDRKYYEHYEVYDPSKPRDINAINAKRYKKGRVVESEGETSEEEKEGAVTVRETVQEFGQGKNDKENKSSLPTDKKSATSALPVPHAPLKVTQGTMTDEKIFKKQEGHTTKIAGEKTRLSQQMASTTQHPHHQKRIASKGAALVADATVEDRCPAVPPPVKKRLDFEDFESFQAWAVAAAPRPFKDKHDQFQYWIELRKGELKWIIKLDMSTSTSVKTAYRFWAGLYDKGTKPKVQETRNPTVSLAKAMDEFKLFFRGKTGYNWDERLLRAQKAQPNWQYQVPPKGKPTGSAPSQYTPGHPECVKPEALAPIIMGVQNKRKATEALRPERQPKAIKHRK